MNKTVHHLPPSAVDALGRLVGRQIEVKILQGYLSADGLTADDMILLVWEARGLRRAWEMSSALLLRGRIEEGIWISMWLEEHPQADLFALNVLEQVEGFKYPSQTSGVRLFPSPKAHVTSVELFEETFTVDAEGSLPAVTVTADCRLDITFDRGDPICFEIGAAGVGFFHIHRSRSAWAGRDHPKVTLRHSFTTPVHAHT